MTATYDIQNEPIVISKGLIDQLKDCENWSDMLALYIFYYYTAKWQKTNQVRCTTGYAAEGLKWSEERVRRTKKLLIEKGLVEDYQHRNNINQIVGHYIKVNFVWGKSTIQTLENPDPGETPTVGTSQTNALSALNGNALSADKEMLALSKSDNALSVDTSLKNDLPINGEKKEKKKRRTDTSPIGSAANAAWKWLDDEIRKALGTNFGYGDGQAEYVIVNRQTAACLKKSGFDTDPDGAKKDFMWRARKYIEDQKLPYRMREEIKCAKVFTRPNNYDWYDKKQIEIRDSGAMECGGFDYDMEEHRMRLARAQA